MFKYNFQDEGYNLSFGQQFKMHLHVDHYDGQNLENFKIQAIVFYDLVRAELNILKMLCFEEGKEQDWLYADEHVHAKFKTLLKKYFFNSNMMLDPSKKNEMVECLFENYKNHLEYMKLRHENDAQIMLDWLAELPDTLDNLLEELFIYKESTEKKPTFYNGDLYKEIKMDDPITPRVDPAA
jgi:hypothetical protein